MSSQKEVGAIREDVMENLYALKTQQEAKKRSVYPGMKVFVSGIGVNKELERKLMTVKECYPHHVLCVSDKGLRYSVRYEDL